MSTDSTLRVCNESLLRDLIPYAKRAARSARFRWNLDEDDVFQQIMLDAWRKIEQCATAENPLAWMRKGIRFSIGHSVQERFWRKGNGVTDQLGDDYDAGERMNTDQLLDMQRAIKMLDRQQLKALHLTWTLGHSVADAARIESIPRTTMEGRVKDAASKLALHMGHDVELKREYGSQLTLIHDNGNMATGSESEILRETGLSRGSFSNIKTGKRESVKGWRLA